MTKAGYLRVSFLMVVTASLLLTIPFPLSLASVLLTGLAAGAIAIEILCHRMTLPQLKSFGQACVIGFSVFLILQWTGLPLLHQFDIYHDKVYELTLLVTSLYLTAVLWLKLKEQPSSPPPTRLLLVTPSALEDPRLLSLANSGLLDNKLSIPSSLRKKYEEPFLKLQQLPHLQLKTLTVHPLLEDPMELVQLAKKIHADLLTSDHKFYELAQSEGVRLMSLQALYTALKPQVPVGQSLNIKIQRPGKEADQGIGYLEDGTMVVVNGAGSHVGKIIESQILSIHQTATGRMIFCNSR